MPILNQQLASRLQEIAELKQVLGENRFKVVAYERAAQNLLTAPQDVAAIYQTQGLKGLEAIEGIGTAIAKHIEEYLKTGRVKQWERLRRRVAPTVLKLMEIPGIGPKTAAKLANTLEVVSIAGLEKSLSQLTPPTKAKLSKIGLKQQSIDNILRGIDILTKQEGRTLLLTAAPIVDQVTEYMKGAGLKKFDVVGSFRRRKETVGDLDFIGASSRPSAAIDYFVNAPYVDKIINQGETKARIIHQSGQQIDFEILPKEKYGSLLQHFTGSKDHNVALRTWGAEHGFSISEHGIKLTQKSKVKSQNYRSKLKTCQDEECVYNTLGMDWIPPELRENRGEIEAALNHQLPKLIEPGDIKGDLQVHTNWSDGHDTVFEMARAAQDIGYEYLALTDHSPGLGVAHGLNEQRLRQRQREIDRAQRRLKIKILAGVEVNIKANGQLDLPNHVLKRLDFVLAAVHSSFNQNRSAMTQRIINALKNPLVHGLAHPTGRLIEKRPAYDADWPTIFRLAGQAKKTLEIDGFPNRLDLPDFLVKQAKDYRVKLTIGTDSHQVEHLQLMRYGVWVARRGWLTKDDVLNTQPLNVLLTDLSRSRTLTD